MPNPNAPTPRAGVSNVAGTILLLAGLGLLVFTVILERRQEKIFSGALHTNGTIVAMLPKHGERVAPLVRYRTNQGIQIDFTSGKTSSSYTVGQAVPVVYPPLNPQQAEIDSWSSRWLLTTLYGFLAAVFIALGGAAVFWKSRAT